MSNPVEQWQPEDGAEPKSWDEAETAWDRRAEGLGEKTPLITFKKNPNLPGIRKKTRKNLNFKTLRYMHDHDESGVLRKYFWRYPLKHGVNLLRKLTSKQAYVRDGDFFFYGLKDTAELCREFENPRTLLVVGFSYCHKPFECPAGRFTDACYRDQDSEVCAQCFIGKSMHFLPRERIVPLFSTTVHYLGEQMVKLRETRPDYDLLFLITACELTLVMFGVIGASVGFRGIGVRLDGQICNTMRAFEASEEGIKPGLAIVTEPTQARMMEVYRQIDQQLTGGARTAEFVSSSAAAVTDEQIIATDRLG